MALGMLICRERLRSCLLEIIARATLDAVGLSAIRGLGVCGLQELDLFVLYLHR